MDGKWGKWSKWSLCSLKCGGGIKERTRVCNNPAPSDGGRACGGGATGTVKCNTAPCRTVVDGGFRYPYCLANIFLVSNNSNVINYSFRNGGVLNHITMSPTAGYVTTVT